MFLLYVVLLEVSRANTNIYTHTAKAHGTVPFPACLAGQTYCLLYLTFLFCDQYLHETLLPMKCHWNTSRLVANASLAA